MRILAIAVLVMMTASLSFADQLELPFECYPKSIQEKFAKHGKKLDLSGNDKTPDSWGFLENKGSKYVIYTYKPLEIPDEIDLVQKIIMEK